MSGKKKRRRKKKLRPAFEARRDESVPEGFDVNLGNVTQDEAYATIKARLDDARKALPEGYSGRVLMHAYVDGSVDGELYVMVPEDDYQGNATWNMHEAFSEQSVGRHYWISMGARYIIEKDDEIYRRHKGLNQVQTNYQRATQTNIAEEDVVLRTQVLRGMKKRFKREAHSVFIRLHWNPENKQPKR